jgi:DNA polymerase-3 subunit alpha (Gram-positive type)
MVSGAPRFVDVMPSFLGFIGHSIVVAHNAQFDLRFLNYEIGMIHEEYRLGNQHLCTVQLSKKLMPELENHRLNTLARHFSIPLVNHHRASDDARATAEIFLNLLEMLSGIGITDLDEVRALRRPATTTAGAQ